MSSSGSPRSSATSPPAWRAARPAAMHGDSCRDVRLPGYGRRHCWFEAPLQAQIWSCVPLVVMPAGSSKHLPVAGLTSCPLIGCHCWFAPPLHVHHSTRVPLAELFPVISRQPPSMVMVPLLFMVQLCAAAKPLQSNICTLLPGVAAAL